MQKEDMHYKYAYELVKKIKDFVQNSKSENVSVINMSYFQGTEQSMNAGLDMEMMSVAYINYLEELVAEGRVSLKQIDDAVYRVLKLKEGVNPHPVVVVF